MKFVLPAFGEYSPLKVHDSMLSTHFAFALLSARRADINSCNNKSVEEASDHLAYLFQLGKLPDLTCLLLFLMFDIKSHKKIQGFSADKKSACQVASLCSGE